MTRKYQQPQRLKKGALSRCLASMDYWFDNRFWNGYDEAEKPALKRPECPRIPAPLLTPYFWPR